MSSVLQVLNAKKFFSCFFRIKLNQLCQENVRVISKLLTERFHSNKHLSEFYLQHGGENQNLYPFSTRTHKMAIVTFVTIQWSHCRPMHVGVKGTTLIVVF